MARRGKVRVIGADELHKDLVEMIKRVGDKSLITARLEVDMRKFAHIITGFMKSTIYHNRMIAGADAYYAGFEADRGGSHDYAQRAINAFPRSE
ncbi:MAG: hypothetical protein HWN68_19695, partial [Desulfobacterales bacterium]|nr:hypothetical protein [Desulfobacterales bacterium]